MRSHPNKAVDVVVCQTFQIALGFRVIDSCLLLGTTFFRNRSDSFCSPWPLGRRWCHRYGHALA
jgi:hypothetical protein